MDNKKLQNLISELQKHLESTEAEKATFDAQSTAVAAAQSSAEYISPTQRKERKAFGLVGGAALSVELMSGKPTMTIEDIAADDTPLYVGISHVFNAYEKESYYGANFNLNLCNKLELVSGLDKWFATPVFTDATGTKYTMTVRYYIEESGKKKYLTDDEVKRIIKSGDKLMLDTKEVKHDYLRVGNYSYVEDFTLSLEENAGYNEIKDTAAKPVRWVRSGNVYSGFDNSGKFTFTTDEFNNYTIITYDSVNRITKVKDGNGNFYLFTYLTSLVKKLSKITDSRGRIVEYTYNASGCIDKILFYDNGGTCYKTLNLKYGYFQLEGKYVYVLSDIQSSDTSRAQISFAIVGGLNKIKTITYYCQMDSAAEQQVSKITFNYDSAANSTDIVDDFGNSVKYVFNSDGFATEYYEIFNNLVSCAELYNYVPFEKEEKTVIKRQFLNNYSYANFKSSSVQSEISSAANEYTLTTLNGMNNPVKAQTDNIQVTDTSKKTVYTYYSQADSYGDPGLIESATEVYNSNMPFYYETKRFYNEKGTLTSQNTWEQHGNTRPIYDFLDMESYTYDKKGCIIRTRRTRYDPYSGRDKDYFYTDSEYNANRQLTKEYNELGENATNYRYVDNTNLVNMIISPISSIMRYAYDGDDRLSRVYGQGQSGEQFYNENYTEYENGEISSMFSGADSNKIEFTYDAKCRPVTVKLDGEVYESYEYNEEFVNFTGVYDEAIMTNANGESFAARAYRNGSKEVLFYNDATILTKDYDEHGLLSSIEDSLTNNKIRIRYDTCGNATGYSESKGVSETYTLDERAQIKQIDYSGSVERTDKFTYAGYAHDYVKNVETGNYSVDLKYDLERRYRGKTVYLNGGYMGSESVTYIREKSIEYEEVDGKKEEKEIIRDTHMPCTLTVGGIRYDYSYDSRGNISEIKKEGETIARYKYDYLNRLERDDSKALNMSTKYSYDEHGNIIKRQIWSFSLADNLPSNTRQEKSYVYDEKGKLLYTYWSYGTGDEYEFMSKDDPVTYDSMGNPLKWNNGSMTWERGRKLVQYGNTTFKYDGLGRRIEKNSITFTYDSQGRLIKQSNGLEFFYDTMGVLGFTYNGETYTYRKDIQGNVIAILDSTGAVVVEYSYDAWGRFSISGDFMLGYTINPFKYRSYYYDTDTRLYYLQTRYYDPYIGRFINRDSISYADPTFLNGLNLYAYCNNNPVMYVDPTGYSLTIGIGIGIGYGIAALVALLGIAVVEATYHPIANTINEIGGLVEDLIAQWGSGGGTIVSTPSIDDEISAIEGIKDGILSNLRFRDSGGRDSGLIGLTDEQLDKLLEDANRRGDTQLVKRIIREMKIRGNRNKRKKRGGPHMRGLLLLLLLGGLLGEDYELTN